MINKIKWCGQEWTGYPLRVKTWRSMNFESWLEPAQLNLPIPTSRVYIGPNHATDESSHHEPSQNFSFNLTFNEAESRPIKKKINYRGMTKSESNSYSVNQINQNRNEAPLKSSLKRSWLERLNKTRKAEEFIPTVKQGTSIQINSTQIRTAVNDKPRDGIENQRAGN